MVPTGELPTSSSLLDGSGLWQIVSADQLNRELAETEQQLAFIERGEATNNSSSLLSKNHSDDPKHGSTVIPLPTENPVVALSILGKTADDLLLANDYASWMASAVRDTTTTMGESWSSEMTNDAGRCESLGQLLRRHCVGPKNSLFHKLLQTEFLPSMEYLRTMLILELRKALRQSGYPSKESCALLMEEYEDNDNNNDENNKAGGGGNYFRKIASIAKWLYRLQVENNLIASHIQGTSGVRSDRVDDVVLELCRPFVERIRYHFVVVQQQDSNKNRIERLPEWLLAYIQEHILLSSDNKNGGASPWELIRYALSPMVRSDLALDFVNEILRLIQWVFAQNNVFRHSKLCGQHSQPMLLCNVIEQVLHFDDCINQLIGPQWSKRVLSLMDIYVAGDDEILQWWLEREREAMFDSLLHGRLLVVKSEKDEMDCALTLLSPRAELFCSLLRSMKRKATVFSFSGPYLSHVAAPLCLHFLEAVQGSAASFKDDLLQYRKLPSARALQSSVKDWIKLINGTHLSALLLLEQDAHNDDANDTDDRKAQPSRSTTANEEMNRFGKSLQRLEQVLVDEFASLFVEKIVLEKAKLASYFMRCSHMLANEEENTATAGDDVNNTECYSDISPDLADTQYVLHAFLEVVSESPMASSKGGGLSPSLLKSREKTLYASRALRDRVLTVLSENFLEVALDWHGTTPDISTSGGQAFAADIKLLFGDALQLPPTALRLLDVAGCMAISATHLSIIGDALCGLAGQERPPLTEDMFTMDERVYDEAMSMIYAKNILFIPLGDFLSILNRRSLRFQSALWQ